MWSFTRPRYNISRSLTDDGGLNSNSCVSWLKVQFDSGINQLVDQ